MRNRINFLVGVPAQTCALSTAPSSRIDPPQNEPEDRRRYSKLESTGEHFAEEGVSANEAFRILARAAYDLAHSVNTHGCAHSAPKMPKRQPRESCRGDGSSVSTFRCSQRTCWGPNWHPYVGDQRHTPPRSSRAGRATIPCHDYARRRVAPNWGWLDFAPREPHDRKLVRWRTYNRSKQLRLSTSQLAGHEAVVVLSRGRLVIHPTRWSRCHEAQSCRPFR